MPRARASARQTPMRRVAGGACERFAGEPSVVWRSLPRRAQRHRAQGAVSRSGLRWAAAGSAARGSAARGSATARPARARRTTPARPLMRVAGFPVLGAKRPRRSPRRSATTRDRPGPAARAARRQCSAGARNRKDPAARSAPVFPGATPPTPESNVRARSATRGRCRTPPAPRCDGPRQRDPPSAGPAGRPARAVATRSRSGTVAHGAVYPTNAAQARRSAPNVPGRHPLRRGGGLTSPVPIRAAALERPTGALHPLPPVLPATPRRLHVAGRANAGHHAVAAPRTRSRRRARTRAGRDPPARCSRSAPRGHGRTSGAEARAGARSGLESRTPSEPRVRLASSHPFSKRLVRDAAFPRASLLSGMEHDRILGAGSYQ